MNSILPVINMLVYMLALHYLPGMRIPYVSLDPDVTSVVYPYNLTEPLYYDEPMSLIAQVEPVEMMPFVPNVTPTNQKRARGIFHRMVKQSI